MSRWYIERDRLNENHTASASIARHLYTRQLLGKAIIITDNPAVQLSAVRRQWLKCIQTITRERYSTLDNARAAELDWQIERMKELRFVTAPPSQIDADVYLISPDHLPKTPLDCVTAYICPETVEYKQLEKLLPHGCLVVVYKHAESQDTKAANLEKSRAVFDRKINQLRDNNEEPI